MSADTALEEHIAHHAAAIDDISKQMAEQWTAIRRLEAKLDRVLDHLRGMQDDTGPAPDARPPHY